MGQNIKNVVTVLLILACGFFLVIGWNAFAPAMTEWGSANNTLTGNVTVSDPLGTVMGLGWKYILLAIFGFAILWWIMKAMRRGNESK